VLGRPLGGKRGAGAGFFENDRQRLTLRAEGQVRYGSQLGEDPGHPGPADTPVRLREVAEVVEGAAPKYGGRLVNGHAGA